MKRIGRLLFLPLTALLLASCETAQVDSSSSSSSVNSSSTPADSSPEIEYGSVSVADGISGGTISFLGVEDVNRVAVGTEVEVEATPNPGYSLDALTVNGEDILDSRKFTVSEPIEYVVDAEFSKIPPVEVTGTIDFSGIPDNNNFTLKLDYLVTDNIDVSAVSSSTLYNDDDYTDGEVRLGSSKNEGYVTFTFAEPISIQEVTLDVRQYKSYNSNIDVIAGDIELTQSYSDPTYRFSGVETDTLTIHSSGGTDRFILEGLSITYGSSTPAEPVPATVNVVKTGEGTVTLNPTSGYMVGDTLEVTATPAKGYYLSNVTMNGRSGDRVSSYVYSFRIRDAANTVNVIFRESTGENTDFGYLYANDVIKPDRGSQSVTIDEYYEPVRGLKGEALKDGLHDIIDEHKEFSYGSLGQSDWERIDVDPFDSSSFYVTYQGPKKKGYKVNKEHTWAKSHGKFEETPPAGSDIHNLRGSNSNLNSTRGNLDFGEVSHTSSNSIMNFSWAESDMEGNYRENEKYFEPKDEFKGDVARIIFYMATRYDGGSGEPDLEVGGDIDTSRFYDFTAGATGEHGNFADLYEWATSGIDPVSDYEVNRNNNVDQDYQHNRNPFIDHPEFIIMIYDKSYDGPGALE